MFVFRENQWIDARGIVLLNARSPVSAVISPSLSVPWGKFGVQNPFPGSILRVNVADFAVQTTCCRLLKATVDAKAAASSAY